LQRLPGVAPLRSRILIRQADQIVILPARNTMENHDRLAGPKMTERMPAIIVETARGERMLASSSSRAGGPTATRSPREAAI